MYRNIANPRSKWYNLSDICKAVKRTSSLEHSQKKGTELVPFKNEELGTEIVPLQFAVECVESRLIPNVLSALNQNLKSLATSSNSQKHGPTIKTAESNNDRSAMYHRVLTQEIMSLDRSLLQKASSIPDNSGTTCLLGLLFDNELIIANVGDCRAIMYDNRGRTLQLTIDHKPQNPTEKDRIRQAGGFVSLSGAGIWRLNGILSVSRGLGDLSLKRCNNVITARPDIHVYPLHCTKASSDGKDVLSSPNQERRIVKDDQPQLEPHFVVAASDGLWNVMSNAEVSKFLLYPVDRIAHDPDYGARALALRALALGSTDNVTVLIVKFAYPKRNSHAPVATIRPRTPSPPLQRRNLSSCGPYVDTRISWHRGPEDLHKSLLRKSQVSTAATPDEILARTRGSSTLNYSNARSCYTPPPLRSTLNNSSTRAQGKAQNGDIPIPVQYCTRSKTPPPLVYRAKSFT